MIQDKATAVEQTSGNNLKTDNNSKNANQEQRSTKADSPNTANKGAKKPPATKFAHLCEMMSSGKGFSFASLQEILQKNTIKDQTGRNSTQHLKMKN